MAGEKQCRFGACKKYCVCDKCDRKEERDTCSDFEPCLTYMDKYNNDVELWEDLHGW